MLECKDEECWEEVKGPTHVSRTHETNLICLEPIHPLQISKNYQDHILEGALFTSRTTVFY